MDSNLDLDKINANVDNRIKAPLKWFSSKKFEIINLQSSYYDEVIKLIERHYLLEEPLCRSTELIEDPVSKENFLKSMRLWIKDRSSVIACSQKTRRIVGVAVTRINSNSEKTNTFSRVKLFEGDALEKIMDFNNSLVKRADVFKALNVESSLRVYILCVHPSYKKHGVGSALLDACTLAAANMKTPITTGVFTSHENQLCASNAGFKLLNEINYNDWLHNNEIVFHRTGTGNFSAAFMYKFTDSDNLNDDKKLY